MGIILTLSGKSAHVFILERVTHWDLDKISKYIFLNENNNILIEISLIIYPRGPIKSEPLFKPTLT